MEPKKETRMPHGTRFFTPTEHIVQEGFYFESRKQPIGDLGIASLFAANHEAEGTYLYPPDVLGIAVDGNKIDIKPAHQLCEDGFFSAEIQLRHGVPHTNIKCEVLLPDNRRARSTITTDIDSLEPNPIERNFGYTDMWRLANDENEYLFFVRKNPQDLSGLEFFFFAE